MSPSLGTSPHGTQPRGLESTPSSSQQTGRFGRMFRRLPVFETDAKCLGILGLAMIQMLDKDPNGTLVLDKPLGVDDDDENTAKLGNGELRLPAGYTYFGQFVDHDITHDPISSLTRENDPDALATSARRDLTWTRCTDASPTRTPTHMTACGCERASSAVPTAVVISRGR